jgi:hypothetical protein
VTAPHANSSHFRRSARKKTFAELKLFDASPCNSAAVGIFAKTSPFCVNPFGGHMAAGDGITFLGARFFFFTTFFFFVAGFFVAFAVALAVALAVGLALGFGVEVAATAEVAERVSVEMRKSAINFFNLYSI